MADKKYDDALFEDVPYQAPKVMDDSLFEDAPAETSAMDSVKNFLTGMADTTVGRVAAGGSTAIADYLSQFIKSDVDKKLAEQGFDVKELPYSPTESYYAGKESLAKEVERAREESPIATTLGSIGSEIAQSATAAKGLGVGGQTGSKLKDLGKLLGMSTTEGALSELSRGDAKLLEGDIAGSLKEAGQGAAMGLASGASGALLAASAPKIIEGVGKVATKGAGKIAKGIMYPIEELTSSLKEADTLKGLKYVAKRASREGSRGVEGLKEELVSNAETLGKNFVEKVNSARSNIGKTLEGYRKLVPKTDTVDLKQYVNDLDDLMNEIKEVSFSKEGVAFEDAVNVQKYLKSLRSKDLSKVPYEKASSLADDIKSKFTALKDGKPEISDLKVQAILRDFSKGIKGTIDDLTLNALEKQGSERAKEFIELNRKYKTLVNLEDSVGIRTRSRIKFGESELKKVSDEVVKKLTDETSNLKSSLKQKEIIDSLRDVGLGDYSNEILNKIDDINAGLQSLQYSGGQNVGAFAAGTRALARTAASVAGKVKGEVGRKVVDPLASLKNQAQKIISTGAGKAEAATKSVMDTMKKSDSQQLRAIADELEKAGKVRFSGILKQVVETSDPTEKAIRMHAIMQQPAFRKDLRDILGIENEE